MNTIDFYTFNSFITSDGWKIPSSEYDNLRQFLRNPHHKNLPQVQRFITFLAYPIWDIHDHGFCFTQFYDILETYDDDYLEDLPWDALQCIYIPQQYPRLKNYQNNASHEHLEYLDQHFQSTEEQLSHFHAVLEHDKHRVTNLLLALMLSELDIIVPPYYFSLFDDTFMYDLLHKHGYKRINMIDTFVKNYRLTPQYHEAFKAFTLYGHLPEQLCDTIAILFELSEHPEDYPFIDPSLDDMLDNIRYSDFHDEEHGHDIYAMLQQCALFHQATPFCDETSLHI